MNMKLVERVTEEKESTREKTANTLPESPFLLVSDGTRPSVTSHQMMHKEPAPLYHRPRVLEELLKTTWGSYNYGRFSVVDKKSTAGRLKTNNRRTPATSVWSGQTLGPV